MNLKDFMSYLERKYQYGVLGNLGNANDQPTLDILNFINQRGTDIWAEADWKWSRELLSIVLVPNQRQYVVSVVSGNPIDRIQDLIPYDPTGAFLQGEPLQERTIRDFYKRNDDGVWLANSVPSSAPGPVGFPCEYENLGLDANGNWNVIFSPLPNTAGKIGGYAKPVLYAYTIADVAANVAFKFFPNNVQIGALSDGVGSDIRQVQNNFVEAARLDGLFKSKLAKLVKTQTGVATDNSPITTRLPSIVRRMYRGRRR